MAKYRGQIYSHLDAKGGKQRRLLWCERWSGRIGSAALLFDSDLQAYRVDIDCLEIETGEEADAFRVQMWTAMMSARGKLAVRHARLNRAQPHVRIDARGRTTRVSVDCDPSPGVGHLEAWHPPMKLARSVERGSEMGAQFERYLSYWSGKHFRIVAQLQDRHPEQYEVYMRVAVNDEEPALVAEAMGISRWTVYSHRRNALTFIRNRMGDQDHWINQ